MGRHRQNVQQIGKLVTPAIGIQRELSSPTFESFLPLKYQLIEEGHETVSFDDEVKLRFITDKGKEPMLKTLKFIPPTSPEAKLIVKIAEDDVHLEAKQWETSRVGYVIGDKPYDRLMENCITSFWNFVANFRS
ncbi:hypothetical protein HAX54_038431 [Datura stramonium]|uniref:Uncharacterized protein n=1 Tax=Datura stramonium TaxID=4076 RepID=A0ABS8SI55_DATST|nr:hypothetical protein [Datura stramonium]